MEVILGAGPLSKAVMRELLNKGKRVRVVNSSGKANVPAEVEVVQADLMSASGARAALQGANNVFQCAQPPYHRWEGLFQQLMGHITEAASYHQANLVMGDNLYMYGDVSGPIHEGLPYEADTRKGKVRAEIAQGLLDLHRKGTVKVAIGRGADFYGPYVNNSYVGARFFASVAAGKACSLLGDLDAPHTFTYIDDFGRALVTLSEHEDAFGQAWHVPHAETVSTRQFAELAYEAAGHSPRIGTMGRGMLRLGGLFIPAAREVIEMLYQFEKPFDVDCSKFIRRFGEKAGPTPLRTALKETIAWHREQATVKV
ncbi:NAD-dependent epimerase/dehydratase family protein [Paenibacillus aceris]|uniref:Nucleoside-diphosphate-sugar epimerase n=1 Tax=Paenibacillus aceris TaxID=869555 RepID=A0ABS4HZF8_9BACL|nr:NAD-dependent epimerase/dehydratase family protein [Paenibacillus aceris]MBP1963938.1 nucleoside-diphosphate-sugar epimerase [Paenibacillus aceris]NHW34643.1 NAD-dependent epimerase/dehydratase family protein [Paenibacillus aceris]